MRALLVSTKASDSFLCVNWLTPQVSSPSNCSPPTPSPAPSANACGCILMPPTGQPSPSQEMDQLFQNFLLMLLGRRPWGNNMSKAWRNPFSEPVASGWFKIARQNPHPIHCWWQCKLVQPLRKTVWSVLKN